MKRFERKRTWVIGSFALLLAGIWMGSLPAHARINVVTTTTTLKSMVEKVGGDRVSVRSITEGSQDPHFIDAKPSYMLMLRNADLLVSVGLSLEEGWLPILVRGSRNPKLQTPSGHFVTGQKIEPIEVPRGGVDRSQGDVHPEGNPHYYLDPERTRIVTGFLAEHLAGVDPKNAMVYRENAQKFQEEIQKEVPEWQARIQKSGIQKVVTYHKLLNYFLDRFSLQSAGTIEAKPGIPPTARHLKQLVETIRAERVSCLLNSVYYDLEASQKIQSMTPIHVQVVATEVGAAPGTGDYFALIEQLVAGIEKCGASARTSQGATDE